MTDNNPADIMIDSPMEVEEAEQSTSAINIAKQNRSSISEMDSRLNRLEQSGVLG